MLWKIYVLIFFIINAISLIAFNYSQFDLIAFVGLVLSLGLNIAVFSYAFKKPIFPRAALIWLFKLNIGLYGLFLIFEALSFIQELIGTFGINLPTAGLVSIIAGFPSLPALYANYKLAYQPTSSAYPKASKSKKKSKKKNLTYNFNFVILS